jgi:hypothetical protein
MLLSSRATLLAGSLTCMAIAATCATASGITVYKGDHREFVKTGGRIQLQYRYEDPDNEKLDFDTPVNKDDEFNEDWMLGDRADYHPFGEVKNLAG